LLTDAGGVGAGGVGAGAVGAGAVAARTEVTTVDPFWHCEMGFQATSDEAQQDAAVEYEAPHEGLRP